MAGDKRKELTDVEVRAWAKEQVADAPPASPALVQQVRRIFFPDAPTYLDTAD